MKRIILAMTMALTATAFTGSAQEKQEVENLDNRQKFMIGLKIGTNYSNVYNSRGEDFDADGKFGFAAGGFVAIPLGIYLGFQPEILFSQKGFQATGTILEGSYEFTRTTNYIDVPLLLAIKPIEFITLLVGPQYSYLIKQRDVFKNATTSIAQEEEFENDDIRKNTLCFTGGVDINMHRFVLGTRAGWDVLNNNGDGSSTTPRYKNVWMQATLGIRF